MAKKIRQKIHPGRGILASGEAYSYYRGYFIVYADYQTQLDAGPCEVREMFLGHIGRTLSQQAVC